MSSRRVVLVGGCGRPARCADSAESQSLDFGVYQSTVEPIFLTKRDGFTRCVVCHGGATTPSVWSVCARGVNTYTEDQSRKNFEMVSRLVVPGKPEDSHLLMYPLVPDEGGARLSLRRPAMAEQERSELAGDRPLGQRTEIAAHVRRKEKRGRMTALSHSQSILLASRSPACRSRLGAWPTAITAISCILCVSIADTELCAALET